MLLSSILKSNGAASAASIPFEACRVTDPPKLSRFGFLPRSVCVGIIPYYTPACDGPRTVSAYAVPRDYHIFVRAAAERIADDFGAAFPGERIRVCGDNSPIDEADAAARAGLGVIGRNRLLITPEHSSFVFIFEAFSTLPPEREAVEPGRCLDCGRCAEACPAAFGDPEGCLSALTQKKGELSPGQEELIRRNRSVWGCDVCQLVCPYTERARRNGTLYSTDPWFLEHTIACPDPELIRDGQRFRERAYSWRGPGPILRNLALLGEGGGKE